MKTNNTLIIMTLSILIAICCTDKHPVASAHRIQAASVTSPVHFNKIPFPKQITGSWDDLSQEDRYFSEEFGPV